MTSVMRAGVVSKSMLFFESDLAVGADRLEVPGAVQFRCDDQPTHPLALVPLSGASPLCVSKRLLFGGQVIPKRRTERIRRQALIAFRLGLVLRVVDVELHVRPCR